MATYTITTNVTLGNASSSNPTTIDTGKTASLSFNGYTGYLYNGNTTVTGADFTTSLNDYDALIVTLSNPTANVTVNVVFEDTPLNVTFNLTNIHTNPDETTLSSMTSAQRPNIQFIANEGYAFDVLKDEFCGMSLNNISIFRLYIDNSQTVHTSTTWSATQKNISFGGEAYPINFTGEYNWKNKFTKSYSTNMGYGMEFTTFFFSCDGVEYASIGFDIDIDYPNSNTIVYKKQDDTQVTVLQNGAWVDEKYKNIIINNMYINNTYPVTSNNKFIDFLKANLQKVVSPAINLDNLKRFKDNLVPSINASGHELNIANGKIQLLDANGTMLSQVDLPEGGKIDTISVNGVNQPITNKNVNIVTPVIEILESED